MKASTILAIAAGVAVVVYVAPRVLRAVRPATTVKPSTSPIAAAERALDPTVAGSPLYNAIGSVFGTGALDFLGGLGAQK